ncbi:MAG: DUF3365 domain-containing protein [Proteobacteria bacterium]|nr:DUF3365 domain-containing protein [Pseudomonadota bacterium]
MLTSNKFVRHQIMFTGLILILSGVFSVAAYAGASEEVKQRAQASKQVAQQFVKQLGGHLKKEMKANGPVQAIKVCKEIAPGIANQLSIENGWSVSRVSSKVRNPSSGLPDKWESEVLAEFEALAAKGEKFSSMKKVTVVEENGKSYFRFMKPIPVKPVCLSCHGGKEDVSATVQAELAKQYPFDKAKGYKLGELRGAISIKQPMDIPLKKKF